MPTYWQVSAGSDGREYSQDFIRFGLAFVGGAAHVETMRRVQVGDRIILRLGRQAIFAVGEVIARNGSHNGYGDKKWLLDYDGWELQAYCNVAWHIPPNPVPVSGLTRTTIERTLIPDVIKEAERILIDYPVTEVETEPAVTRPVADEELVEFLISEGLRIGDAEELTIALRRIRRLANYYYQHPAGWGHTREHETRTFLIIPLLLALGWSEQAIKIEQPTNGGRVDIALFDTPFTVDATECIALIETKGFAQGLSYAPEQAQNYAKHFPTCEVVFVSNGYCYKAYRRVGGSFSTDASAYLNIRSPRDFYPLNLAIPGALDVVRMLLRKA